MGLRIDCWFQCNALLLTNEKVAGSIPYTRDFFGAVSVFWLFLEAMLSSTNQKHPNNRCIGKLLVSVEWLVVFSHGIDSDILGNPECRGVVIENRCMDCSTET